MVTCLISRASATSVAMPSHISHDFEKSKAWQPEDRLFPLHRHPLTFTLLHLKQDYHLRRSQS